MAAEDQVPAGMTDLVALMYRADWTTLSLTGEVAEFHDFGAAIRMHEPPRPPWMRADRPAHPAGQGKGPSHPGGWPADGDEDGEDDEPDSEEELPGTTELTHRVLLRPGGRFRNQTRSAGGGLSVTTSDGNVSWESYEAGPDDDDPPEDGDDEPPSLSPAQPPLDLLLCPAWLPARFRLEQAGSEVVAGRRALRVIGTRRPVIGRRSRSGSSRTRPAHRSSSELPDRLDRADVLIDADLGILLRAELLHSGQTITRLEVTTLVTDPPAVDDTDVFTPPADPVQDRPRSTSGPGQDLGQLKTAADLGASAMSFMIRHAPRREPPAGSRPDPADTPALAGGPWPGQPGPDEPVSSRVLGLLYAAGLSRADFDAELRTWADSAVGAETFRYVTRNTRLSGVTRLGDALGDLATTWQRREALRIGLPNRFRIDYIDGGMKQQRASAEATDGSQRWRVFPGHTSIGPAQPLPARIARLVDPAWLLDWRLTGGAEVIEGGRRGIRIRIGERWHAGERAALPAPVDAVIDAELGVLLRLTEEQSGRPAKQLVLAGLAVREPRGASSFRIEVPAGTRVVQDSGGLIAELDIPAPVQTAVQLAGKAVGTAVRVGRFLDSMRKQADGNRGDRG
jgi:hypothetical protein